MITVVVPVRNGMPWLEEQLAALFEQKCEEPWEVVVADNGSTDASMSAVKRWGEEGREIRSVDASFVTGPGATRNVGARSAFGVILAFCDADDVVQPGWLQSCVDALGDADAVGGVTDFWSLNGVPPPSPPVPNPPPAMKQFKFLPAALSANLAIRRHAFEDVGGFLEDMMTGEDTDLCWRLQERGYRFVISDSAVVARRDRSGVSQVFSRFVAYGRSGPVLYRRHRDSGMRAEPVLAAKAWLWLVASSPKLVRPDFRVRWVSIAGWRLGRLLESVKQRVFFP